MNRRQRRAMMKKIPNGKKIIKDGVEKAMKELQVSCEAANLATTKQEIEKRVRMLEELNDKVAS